MVEGFNCRLNIKVFISEFLNIDLFELLKKGVCVCVWLSVCCATEAAGLNSPVDFMCFMGNAVI